MNIQQIKRAGLLLWAFAVGGTALVATTEWLTAERIADNERRAMLDRLNQLVPHSDHDNDLFTDVIQVGDPALLGTDEMVPVYRARQGETDYAVIIASVAPDGYSGSIRLLVAIKADGTLLGVRVVSHRETPGLGDGIEIERSPWIKSFDGLSLASRSEEAWAVKRDGGEFDQFTGATITPRAIVKAVRRTLLYFQTHQKRLFDEPAMPPEARS